MPWCLPRRGRLRGLSFRFYRKTQNTQSPGLSPALFWLVVSLMKNVQNFFHFSHFWFVSHLES